MSNEELVIGIQQGDTALYDLLWEQVHKFIEQEARRYLLKCGGLCQSAGVTIDDLSQCGYLALVDAVQAYTLDTGYKFISYLSYPLLNRFNEAAGIRGKKRNPLNDCTSLDKPLGGEANSTLGDMVQDHTAADTLNMVIEREYQAELHNAMEQALLTLDTRQQNVIRYRYYENKTHSSIEEYLGVSQEQSKQSEAKALRELRHPKCIQILKPFYGEIIESQAWHGTGLKTFKETGASSVERALEKAEELQTK